LDEIIRLSCVAKQFPLRTHRSTLLGTLRAALGGSAETRPLRALEDISFSIQRGEKIGLVGGNGSGKSTLMRLVAGIFRPSSGEIHIGARAAGILQAGVGMHRDLSAAENAQLVGALLDLSAAEVRRRLPEILAFAELESFEHAPLRDFSFGMIQRLAFSLLKVAAPPVLLLDELLSGADASFCAKEIAVLEQNREQTLLFAAHDLQLVERLCTRTLLLEKGRVAAFGPTGEVLAQYRGA